jgi:hypothetical protein
VNVRKGRTTKRTLKYVLKQDMARIKEILNVMVYEELGLKHVLETTGIIQSIIRAELHIHNVKHSKNSRLIECLKRH